MLSSRYRDFKILFQRFSLALLIGSISIFLAGCRQIAAPLPSSVVSPSPAPMGTSLSSKTFHDDLLGRPLQLPKMDPGTECPSAAVKQVAPAFGPALGEGPAYAALGVDGILHFDQPVPAGNMFSGSAWGGAKVLWIIAPSYQGPVLVRGARLDGPEGLRFDLGLEPPSELWMDAAPNNKDWRARPSYTRLLVPGCYAYQVDGQGLSEIIVFKALVQQ